MSERALRHPGLAEKCVDLTQKVSDFRDSVHTPCIIENFRLINLRSSILYTGNFGWEYPDAMADGWRDRVFRLMEEQGLTMKELSIRSGLSPSTAHKYLKDGHEPSTKNLQAMAGALGTTVSFLADGLESSHTTIPIVGIVSAGEGWTSSDEMNEAFAVEFSDSDPIAIEVRGDSMAPAYRNGDVLICYRRSGRHADNMIGRDCAVLTEDGRGLIKILKRGSKPGLFTLRSYNPAFDDIEDVVPRWIAPVIWIKRA